MILDEIKKLSYEVANCNMVVRVKDIEKILGEKCKWTYTASDYDYYETSCCNAFQFGYGRKEETFIYCPYCGREIQEQFEVKE